MAMPRSDGGTSLTSLAVDAQRAAGDLLQAGDHAQQGGLAAARGADEHHEFAGLDVEIDAVDDIDATVTFFDVAQAQIGLTHSFTR